MLGGSSEKEALTRSLSSILSLKRHSSIILTDFPPALAVPVSPKIYKVSSRLDG